MAVFAVSVAMGSSNKGSQQERTLMIVDGFGVDSSRRSYFFPRNRAHRIKRSEYFSGGGRKIYSSSFKVHHFDDLGEVSVMWIFARVATCVLYSERIGSQLRKSAERSKLSEWMGTV